MTAQRVFPLVLSLGIAVGVFSGLLHLDAQDQFARARETGGFTRGAILDRTGRSLAHTMTRSDGHAGRAYTVPDAAHLVGYRDPGGRWHGLEARFNQVLQAPRSNSAISDFWKHLQGASAQGNRVRLTLDSAIQRVADRALGHSTGAVVALDPRTGAVLAMVSKPNCSPAQLLQKRAYATCTSGQDHPLLDRVDRRPVAPGSAFKIVTLTAALDSGGFHLDDIFSGPDVFGPSPYFDNIAYPSNITRSDLTALTLEQALAFSDNFTFAHVGLSIGASTLLRYARRFLIDSNIRFDLPTDTSTVAGGKQALSSSETAQASFGAPVDRVTPLQMALVASTVANGGVLMAPRLVQDTESPAGRIVLRYLPRSLGRVMTVGTARQITHAMTFVVDSGSGFRAQIGGIRVAGKTGTADSGGSRPNAWFIAFAPARHPIVAVAVLREHSGEGAQYAAPIARRVIVATLNAHGYHIH